MPYELAIGNYLLTLLCKTEGVQILLQKKLLKKALRQTTSVY